LCILLAFEFIFLLTRGDLLTLVNKSPAHFYVFVKSFCNIFSKNKTGLFSELGSFLNLMVLRRRIVFFIHCESNGISSADRLYIITEGAYHHA